MRRVGRYALLSRFASGDHSELFLARLDDRLPGSTEINLGDACLLELPRAEIASDMEVARLWLAEASAAMRFRHPNAATIYEVDRTGTELFAAQELIEGQSWASVLQRSAVGGVSLPPEAYFYVAAEVANALRAAHERPWSSAGAAPMIHGGISPRSVMLTYEGRVKLLGLGSGRARLHLAPPRSRLHSAAPEILYGRAADRRTDVFGLGVALHDALTGERLFRRGSDAETRAAIGEGEAPPIRKHLSAHGDRVAGLVERMLHRPIERRPSAAEVETELRAMVAGREAALGRRIAEHLAEVFRDEREAQGRIIDVAMRRSPKGTTHSPTEPSPSPPPPRAASPVSAASAASAVNAVSASNAASAVNAASAANAASASSAVSASSASSAVSASSAASPLGPAQPNGDLHRLAAAALEAATLEEIDAFERSLEPEVPGMLGDGGPLASALDDTGDLKRTPIPLVRRVVRTEAVDDNLDEEPIDASLLGRPKALSPADRTLELRDPAARFAAAGDLGPWIEQSTPDGRTPAVLRPEALPRLVHADPVEPTVPLANRALEISISGGGSEPGAVGPVVPAPLVAEEAASPAVARYRRGDLLGTSTLASVYVATDAILGRPVVLKTSDVGDEAGATFDRSTRIRVLRREARIAASLDHPKVARLFDAGRDAGHYFLVYQLIEGESLDRRLARLGRETPAALVRWLRDIAQALGYLHLRGFLHADVSLANVVVEPDGAARLIDLSMVREKQGGSHPLPQGPSAAAAPEVLAGGPYSERAEQFALGWVAYRALTGVPPWPGSGPDLARAMAETPLEPPRAREPAIEPALSSLVQRMLERDPERRFADLHEVTAALDNLGAPPLSPAARAASRAAAPEEGGFSAAALAAGLELLLSRLPALPEPMESRDDAPVLARSAARRLGLGESDIAAAALVVAARAILGRSGGDPARLAGVVPDTLLGALAKLSSRPRRGSEPRVGMDRVVAVAQVVDAYLELTRPKDEALRVSPRRAVVMLRAQADEGELDSRAVEALIDHLREVISALDVARRPLSTRRLLVAELVVNTALHALLTGEGYEVELATDTDEAWRRLSAEVFDAAILDRALPRPRGAALVHRIRDEPRTRDLPLVILGGGVDDTQDELPAPLSAIELVARTAAPQQILSALERRLRPGVEIR